MTANTGTTVKKELDNLAEQLHENTAIVNTQYSKFQDGQLTKQELKVIEDQLCIERYILLRRYKYLSKAISPDNILE